MNQSMIWLLLTYLITVRSESSSHNFIKEYAGCAAGYNRSTITGTLVVFLTRVVSLLYW